jgi:tetratricopeptide (TPR) repeat protein
LRYTNRFWAGPFLARGVTATMGSVAEPYLQFTPDVATFTSALIFRSYNFAEAAYVGSDALSWQTTVVGDPLYRPFRKSPEQLHNHLQEEGSKMIEWSILRLANLGLNAHRTPAEVIQGLEAVETTKHSAVLQEKLGDLYMAAGKPASAIHAYQEALQLQPSPQQKLRLLLTLGDKLSEAGETAKAYQAYHTILKDFPAYPERLAILEKALPLAHKIDKTADAEKFEAEIKKLQPVK